MPAARLPCLDSPRLGSERIPGQPQQPAPTTQPAARLYRAEQLPLLVLQLLCQLVHALHLRVPLSQHGLELPLGVAAQRGGVGGGACRAAGVEARVPCSR